MKTWTSNLILFYLCVNYPISYKVVRLLKPKLELSSKSFDSKTKLLNPVLWCKFASNHMTIIVFLSFASNGRDLVKAGFIIHAFYLFWKVQLQIELFELTISNTSSPIQALLGSMKIYGKAFCHSSSVHAMNSRIKYPKFLVCSSVSRKLIPLKNFPNYMCTWFKKIQIFCEGTRKVEY